MTSFGFDIPASPRPADGPGDMFQATAPGFALVEPSKAGSLIDPWKALSERALAGNPFMHPEFLLPAIETLGHSGIRLATVGGIDGQLLALVPVEMGKLGRTAPAVSVWCHRFGPNGTPLLDRDFADHALSCLLVGFSRHFGRSRAVVFPYQDCAGRVAERLRSFAAACGREIDLVGQHQRARVLRIDDGPDPRADLESRRRKEFARQFRRLGECGQATFETVRDPAPVRARFEEFMALETAGWKGRNGSAMAQQDTVAGFAREAVMGLSAAGHCQIDSLRLDNRAIAMLVSLTGGDLAATWKIAYDEAFARFSPGVQLMLEAPRRLFDMPMVQRIDSLATTDHPMIDRLWHGRLDIASMVLAPTEGLLPYRLGLALARSELALRQRLGRTVHRLRRRRLAKSRPPGDQDSGLARTSAQ